MWRRRRHEGDLSAELESHLDMHIADNMRAGMTPEEARRHALIALGGIEQTKERYRERRRSRWVDELMQDVRFAGRMLVRDRGFALTVVVVLALGIGANSAIFSVVDALMLRPLPFHEPDRLVMIWEDASHVGHPRNTPAPGNYFSWKERNRAFTGMAATRGATANLTVDGPPELSSAGARRPTSSTCSACSRCWDVRSPTKRNRRARRSRSSATDYGSGATTAIATSSARASS